MERPVNLDDGTRRRVVVSGKGASGRQSDNDETGWRVLASSKGMSGHPGVAGSDREWYRVTPGWRAAMESCCE